MKIGIIGGGLIGLSIGYKLSLLGKSVVVFDKDDIGTHQSGRNSGVLHAGLHYKPKSLKAELAVNGIRQMVDFCKNNNVEYEQCGKVVIATDSTEERRLLDLARRGKENGLSGLKSLSKREVQVIEPSVNAYKGLLVPEEGIVNYKGVMHELTKSIQKFGGLIKPNTKITGSSQKKNIIILQTSENEELEFDYIVNCAGLHTDKVFELIEKKKSPMKIIPFRGEYLTFKPQFKGVVNNLIYPTPDPKFPFLGVHFTRTIDGRREVGPNAVLAFAREGYTKTDINVGELIESINYIGLQKFIIQNKNFVLNEFLGSLSQRRFIERAQKMIPDISSEMFERQRTSGVRAQSITREGILEMDFNVLKMDRRIHVLNAPSPGATSSLAIADYIINKYLLI
jgi:L-2-hydroxyglutarate oxidase